MKQYVMRATDRTSSDMDAHNLPCCPRRLTQENEKTYMHNKVDDDMNIMKNG